MSPKIKTLYDLDVEIGKIKPELAPFDVFQNSTQSTKSKFSARYRENAATVRRLKYEREQKKQEELSNKILNSKRHRGKDTV